MSEERGMFCTASEDGTVHIWDMKSQDIIRTFLPCEKEELSRPERGRFISCCSMIGDWLVCGGGPKVGLWVSFLLPSVVYRIFKHVRSGELANILDIDQDTPLSMFRNG